MSPPIRDGSGSSIGAIRLGDGSEISEVRTGAGDVVFSGSAIPDKQDLRANHDVLSISASDGDTINWPDETGNGYDLDSGTQPTYKTNIVNDNPVLRFDFGDYLTTPWPDISQPVTFAGVFQFRSVGGEAEGVFGYNGTSLDGCTFLNNRGGDWRLFAGLAVDGGSPDTSLHKYFALFDGSDSFLDIDSITVASGDPGSNVSDGFTAGAQEGDGSFGSSIDYCQNLTYPSDKSGIQSDIESYLDRWF